MSAPSNSGSRTTFEVRSPLDGSLLAELPIHGPDEVQAAVARARTAQATWAARSARDRAKALRRVTGALERRADEIAAVIRSETGKPHLEAHTEVVVCAELIGYYSSVAPKTLRRRRVGTGWLAVKAGYVEYEPYGVVAGITPWNYPLILAMDCVMTALYAGNTVVLKPSEHTSLTGLLIPALLRDAGLPEGLVEVVTGYGGTGEALVRAGVDKIVFTGSTANGRKVMAAAADSVTPLVLELGGKDPAIVLADADFERTARAIVFGAFFNAGQTCVSIERCLVERPIFEHFAARVAELAGRLRQQGGDDDEIGPMITEAQLGIVERQVQDALAKGARALCGGARSADGRGFQPTVLVDVDASMAVLREETFGPVLPMIPVDDEDEAVAIANGVGYGLFASVWTGDRERGLRVGSRLEAGGVSVNDVLTHYGIAGLPMGGVKESGFGRRRGVEGLLEMSRARTLVIDRVGLKREPWWFPYNETGLRVVKAALQWRATPGLRGILRAIRRLRGGN